MTAKWLEELQYILGTLYKINFAFFLVKLPPFIDRLVGLSDIESPANRKEGAAGAGASFGIHLEERSMTRRRDIFECDADRHKMSRNAKTQQHHPVVLYF